MTEAGGQIVDTETALEFMVQIQEQIDKSELGTVVGEMEIKAKRFRELLAADRLAALTQDEVQGILRHTFGTRRKAKFLAETVGAGFFHASLPNLLYGSDDVARRFETFALDLRALSADSDMPQSKLGLDLPINVCCDLASELLHFTNPEGQWLWTRWMWDPKPGTGALPLVVEDGYDLNGASPGEIYTKVGIATAFVRATGDAAGFSKLSNSPFDIDVFLSCVYAVYMYTTLRLRMTQEFNKVVPQLPELIRRLLGVWRFSL
jgi:hypothetical protein